MTFVPLRDSNMSLLSYFVAHIKIAIDDKDVDKEDGTIGTLRQKVILSSASSGQSREWKTEATNTA